MSHLHHLFSLKYSIFLEKITQKNALPILEKAYWNDFYSIKLVCFVFHFVNFIGIQKLNIPKVITVNISQSFSNLPSTVQNKRLSIFFIFPIQKILVQQSFHNILNYTQKTPKFYKIYIDIMFIQIKTSIQPILEMLQVLQNQRT